jgi:hypothetical protein
MRTLPLALAIGLIALGAVTAVPTAAAQPKTFTEDIDDTRPLPMASAACGFPVNQRLVGRVTVKLFTDRKGSVVRELDLLRGTRIIWSAPSKGTSFSYPFNGAAWIDYPQGGTVGKPATLTITGLQDKLPGQPADAGRAVFKGEVIFVRPDGIPVVEPELEPEFISGSRGNLTFPNVCAALAGA